MSKTLIVDGTILRGINPKGDDFHEICHDFEHFGDINDDSIDYETGALVIPSFIKEIASGAFEGCCLFHTIIIPPTVREIYSGAFNNCELLQKIVFLGSNNELVLHSSVFDGCPLFELEYVSITYLSPNYSTIQTPYGGQKTITTNSFGIREYLFLFSRCQNLQTIKTKESTVIIKDLLLSNRNSFLKDAAYYHSYGFKVTYIAGDEYEVNSYKNPTLEWYNDYDSQRYSEDKVDDLTLLYSYAWEKASGLGALMGHHHIRAIDVDGTNNEVFIEKCLSLLGLPDDYLWVVYSGSGEGFHIIFKSDDIPVDITTQAYTTLSDEVSLGVPFHIRLELLWNGHLVLPSSLHPSGSRYMFRKGLPTKSISEVCFSNINDLIDYVSGTIRFTEHNIAGEEVFLACPVKNYSEYGSYGYRVDHKVNDTVEWLEQCKSPRSKVQLALKYLVEAGNQYDVTRCLELLRDAGNEPTALFNLASLIASGIVEGKRKDIEDCLSRIVFSSEIEEAIYKEPICRIKDLAKEMPVGKILGEPYYIFFDTETNGLPVDYNAPSSDIDNWPRLIQLSWIITDVQGELIKEEDHIIIPEDFTINLGAQKIHGISQQKALEEGELLVQILKVFSEDLATSKMIVGHNIEFDMKVVGAEMHRNGKNDVFEGKRYFCTMKNTVDYCCLPGGRKGPKYPKLQELYSIIFGEPFKGAHNALKDILATKSCFFELLNRNLIPKERFNGAIYYSDGWIPSEERPFTIEEIAAVKDAVVVPSKNGKTVQFNMKSGGQTYIPLLPNSLIGVGESILLSDATLVTLKNQFGEKVYRVAFRLRED